MEVGDVMRSNLRSNESHNELRVYGNRTEWETRRGELRERILVSAGLWPLPDKCSLNAKIFDRIEYDDFTVEKVTFESYPGYYVTGNLYRPLRWSRSLAGILNPHGHWRHGRLELVADGDGDQPVEIPTRCANFAKMGIVAFSYDMVGYVDSRQIGHAYEGEEKQIWGSGLLGLQLWNSIRALDFLLTLPNIDSARIGCTGASGGGTQTFLLGAVDERLAVSMPVNMIAADFQGGCRCENAPNLRIDANNVEFAAMFAPRPMLVVGCTGDWTRHLPHVEYPAIRGIYELYGAEANVAYFYDDAGHNYNHKTREAAYSWFGKYLCAREEPWQEVTVEFGDLTRFRIFAERFPQEGISSKEELFAIQKAGQRAALQQLWDDGDSEALAVLRTAMKHTLCVPEHRGAYSAQTVEAARTGRKLVSTTPSVDDADLQVRWLAVDCEDGSGDRIELAHASMRGIDPAGKTLLAVHPGGCNGLFRDESWRSMLRSRLEKGWTIVAPNIHLAGGFGSARDCVNQTSLTTYNLTDTTLRIHDIVTVCRYLAANGEGELHVFGMGDAGVWALAALPFLEGACSAAIDVNGFQLDDEDDARFAARLFVPHYRAAGGFTTSILLSAIRQLTLFRMDNARLAQELQRMCARQGIALTVMRD